MSLIIIEVKSIISWRHSRVVENYKDNEPQHKYTFFYRIHKNIHHLQNQINDFHANYKY